MKIILAKESGFCFGVKRAADMALTKANGAHVNTYGPLIHNPKFIDFLAQKNISIANSLEELTAEKIVIRAHGIPKGIKTEMLKRGLKIIDATCPFVRKVQKLAEEYEAEGYQVIILGEKSHPEIIGLQGYAPNSIVIKSLSDIPKFNRKEKIALIAQTTQNVKIYDEIAGHIRENYSNLIVADTICDATEKRQYAARELAKRVDLMIVIGGKNSSNTTRLKEICEKIVCTHHIESESELQKDWFVNINNVGVTAGASTPDFSIEATINEIKLFNNTFAGSKR